MHYQRVQTIDELKNILETLPDESVILAGGTDVMVEARHKSLQEKYVLDIGSISELKNIDETDETLVIGALVTHQQIVESPLVEKYMPLLKEACNQVGALQIRNRGTIGGNICNASPCADTVPPLMALGTSVEILSPAGIRKVELSEFFEKPYQPHLAQNEVVLRLNVDKLNSGFLSAFYKLGRRNALAISRINMAAILKLNSDKIIEEVRLAPGSVFPTWKRVESAEQFLIGKEANLENFEQAGKLVADEMIAISGRRWSSAYKEPVVAALVKRTLLHALQQKEGAK